MTPDPATAAPSRPLRRCPHARLAGGVAAGLADYLQVDVTAVRVAFVLLALFGGIGFPAYLAAVLLVPEEGSDTSIAEELLGRGRR